MKSIIQLAGVRQSIKALKYALDAEESTKRPEEQPDPEQLLRERIKYWLDGFTLMRTFPSVSQVKEFEERLFQAFNEAPSSQTAFGKQAKPTTSPRGPQLPKKMSFASGVTLKEDLLESQTTRDTFRMASQLTSQLAGSTFVKPKSTLTHCRSLDDKPTIQPVGKEGRRFSEQQNRGTVLQGSGGLPLNPAAFQSQEGSANVPLELPQIEESKYDLSDEGSSDQISKSGSEFTSITQEFKSKKKEPCKSGQTGKGSKNRRRRGSNK